MKRILVTTLCLSLGAAMLCLVAQANNANIVIKRKAPDLSGEIRMEWGKPVSGATVQLCEKGWKNCTVSISTDADGKFKFATIKPKRVNYLLISSFGLNSVEAELKIDKKAKPLVIEMRLE
jgi:hypothetical protein|nr:hypothetical protein [Candidatus Acidoferrales bacterium]